jgi:hypothetical protein
MAPEKKVSVPAKLKAEPVPEQISLEQLRKLVVSYGKVQAYVCLQEAV